MGMELKKIIDTYGSNALYYPDDLANAMREAGIREKETLSLMLVLKCCPAVARLLSQGDISEVEVNALLEAVVRQTGLTVGAAKQTLGKLMIACGVKLPWLPPLLLHKCVNTKGICVAIDADDEVEYLVERLEGGDCDVELLSTLDELARGGSAKVAYALGLYYREKDLEENTEIGRTYFEMAANLGYGPAYGALADYQVRGSKRSIWKAAAYFQRPTAIAGKDGRKWLSLSEELLEYRQENEKRINGTLRIQGIVLVLSLLMVVLLGIEPSFWRTVAVALQGICMVWSLMCRFVKPYHSMDIPSSLMMVSWLILILIGI